MRTLCRTATIQSHYTLLLSILARSCNYCGELWSPRVFSAVYQCKLLSAENHGYLGEQLQLLSLS